MAQMPPERLVETLEEFGQSHVLKWWDELTGDQKAGFADQLNAVDFAELQALSRGAKAETPTESPAQKAKRATSPSQIVRLPQSADDKTKWQQAEQKGWELIAGGKVGAILVAGGQGTRLEFPHPKGMFPIGPVSGHSLFQILVEQIRARGTIAGTKIPYYIMTSDATHAETVDYFEQHEYFGLSADQVKFFKQGNMPAVEAESGKLLLADKDRLCLSPNGHGGLLFALRDAGLIEDMQQRGIEYLHYHQVDNPTAQVCDPAFLGFHAFEELGPLHQSGRQAVGGRKDGRAGGSRWPDANHRVQRLAGRHRRRNREGRTAVLGGEHRHARFQPKVFRRRYWRMTIACRFTAPTKKCRIWIPLGELVEPEKPNAWKFERFIFDALPKAETALVGGSRPGDGVQSREEREPGTIPPPSPDPGHVRDLPGVDGIGGRAKPAFGEVEISPLFALDKAAFQSRYQAEKPLPKPNGF